jgi:hypothetical protein
MPGASLPNPKPAAKIPAKLLLSAHCVVRRLFDHFGQGNGVAQNFSLKKRIPSITQVTVYQLGRNLDGDYWRNGIRHGDEGLEGLPQE